MAVLNTSHSEFFKREKLTDKEVFERFSVLYGGNDPEINRCQIIEAALKTAILAREFPDIADSIWDSQKAVLDVGGITMVENLEQIRREMIQRYGRLEIADEVPASMFLTRQAIGLIANEDETIGNIIRNTFANK